MQRDVMRSPSSRTRTLIFCPLNLSLKIVLASGLAILKPFDIVDLKVNNNNKRYFCQQKSPYVRAFY
jgi:hypothetical protein